MMKLNTAINAIKVIFVLMIKMLISYIAYYDFLYPSIYSASPVYLQILLDIALILLVIKTIKKHKKWFDYRCILMLCICIISISITMISSYSKQFSLSVEVAEIKKESDNYTITCNDYYSDFSYVAICIDSKGLLLEEGREYIVQFKQDIFGTYYLTYVHKKL